MPRSNRMIFDLSQRQRVSDIQHHREADHFGRTVEITERIVPHRRLRGLTFQLKPIYSDNAAGDLGKFPKPLCIPLSIFPSHKGCVEGYSGPCP